MKRNEKKLDDLLDRHLGLFKASSRKEPNEAREAILRRLQSQPGNRLDEASSVDVRPVPFWRSRRPYLMAATAVLVLSVSALMVLRYAAIDAHAVIETVDGSLSRASGGKTQTAHLGDRIEAGEILRTDRLGAGIKLADGSRVELRAHSELSLERADDGVRIHLLKGGVIINAARQRYGHLYVHTKDVTVSVVGTVFLVNAEEEGSRVAVIEGEVRVQHGATEKRLLPGEQLSTSPAMERLRVAEEVSWSQRAPEHIALLQQAPVPAAPARLEFAVASIKPIAANTTIPGTAGGLRGAGLGLACHGTDGVQRVLLTFTHAGQASVIAPQGRCVGTGVFLSTLIEFAYGIQARNVSGGPEWARANGFILFDEAGQGATVLGEGGAYTGRDGFKWLTLESFQIEATADDPSTTTLEQLKQMLQTMLADRFKLKFHLAPSVVSGYALVVGDKGSRLKPVSGDYEESLVPHKGKSTMKKLAQTLGKAIEAPVVDKTGLSGAYDYEFREQGHAGGGAGGRVFRSSIPAVAGVPAMTVLETDRTEQLSSRLEEQLGLRLVPEKALPAEIFVIDSVELPTPN
jgi:uncharacterized protein (TIGR03435 family)